MNIYWVFLMCQVLVDIYKHIKSLPPMGSVPPPLPLPKWVHGDTERLRALLRSLSEQQCLGFRPLLCTSIYLCSVPGAPGCLVLCLPSMQWKPEKREILGQLHPHWTTWRYLMLLKYQEQPAFFEPLFGALCSARHFILFNTHNHFMKEELLVQTFYRWENGSLERSKHFTVEEVEV